MKNLLTILALFSLVFFTIGCGSSQTTTQDDEWTEVSNPLAKLTTQANDIIEAGGLAAVGEGRSSRRDIARQKAQADANAGLSRIFNNKVQTMRENFIEEVGQDEENEVNELFSVVTTELSSQILIGAIEKESMVLQKGDTYLYGALMAITSKTVNQSIMDEMKSKKPQLYQRYRAEEKIKKMEEKMKGYEAELKGE